MIKEIKYNRMIRNYLISLERECYHSYDSTIYKYKDGKHTIFIIHGGDTVKNTNIRKMCSILHIEYNSQTYNMIIDLIKDIYCTNKL